MFLFPIRHFSVRLAIVFSIFTIVCAVQAAEARDDSDRSFSDVVKNANVIPGLFTIYRKEGKAYLEIEPAQFDQLYLCSPTIASGLGERSFLSATMLPEFVFSFHRFGKNVQLLQVNVRYRAVENTSIEKAVRRSFSNSILASGKIVSQPHPDRGSVLIDLSNFFLNDIPLLGYMLEREYRLAYRLDANNSGFAMIKNFPYNTEIEALINFAVDRPSLQSSAANWPITAPDLRSLQFKLVYSLSTLPDTGYVPRFADDRIGHFVAMYQDFTDDRRETPYIRYIARWKLQKQDPNAPLSQPVEPIVFWLENTIPEKYRPAVREGVLVWNKAFEKIGFDEAIVVKQQPDDVPWDPSDVRYNTIRWFVSTDSAFAIGPIRVNPLTGQIYDADIGFSENLTRISRHEFDEFVLPVSDAAAQEKRMMFSRDPRLLCDYSDGAIRQASFGFGLLQARGMLNNQETQDEYVHKFVKHVIAHEVGHALGLRHNFQASTLNVFDNLHDPEFTADRGLSGSLMDYTPVNIAPAGKKQGECWQTDLGPYDYWAIEYAYRQFQNIDPFEERNELKKIASRVAEPQLAYGTDEDAMFSTPTGIDPRSTRWDLSSNPLEYYEQRMNLVRELWRDLETKVAKPGERYQVLRRSFNQGFAELQLDMHNASKYIGGIYNNRDHIGDPGGRLPYEPVAPEMQRKALDLIKTYAFGSDSFQLSPRLLNQLATERDWTFEGNIFGTTRLDYPIHQQVLKLQKSLLDRLHHPVLLSRLQDLEVKYFDPEDVFTISDLFEGLRDSIWAEVRKPDPALKIDSFRRAVQREYLKNTVRLLLTPDSGTPEDARSLARYNLKLLHGKIEKTMASAKLSDTSTKAHLQDSAAMIEEALSAHQHRLVQ